MADIDAQHTLRRRQSSMDLTAALQRLQLASLALSSGADDLPPGLQPILELIKAQTSAIEVLLHYQIEKSSQQLHSQSRLQHNLSKKTSHIELRSAFQSQAIDKSNHVEHAPELSKPHSADTSITPGDTMFCKTNMVNVSNQDSAVEMMPNDGGSLKKSHTQSEPHNISRNPRPFVDLTEKVHSPRKTKKPHTLSIQIPQAAPIPLVSPLTPDRTWYMEQTPAAVARRPESWSAAPPMPTATISLRSKTSMISSSSCPSCGNRDWVSRDQQSPVSSDMICEAHVQEAMSSLISSMKERKKVPLGPLDGGAFGLYSTEYRSFYCVHDAIDKQRLTVFRNAEGWKEMMSGFVPPEDGEVAMELNVLPNCRLVVLPFRPPKHAGWRWHVLEATTLSHSNTPNNQKPKRKVEVMFLGNGFLKLKVRLSELLGEARDSDEPDRFIEFSGIWKSSKGVAHILQHQQKSVGSVENSTQQTTKPLKNTDSGFFSRGPSRNEDGRSTAAGRHENLRHDDDREEPVEMGATILSPISPL